MTQCYIALAGFPHIYISESLELLHEALASPWLCTDLTDQKLSAMRMGLRLLPPESDKVLTHALSRGQKKGRVIFHNLEGIKSKGGTWSTEVEGEGSEELSPKRRRPLLRFSSCF